MWHRNNSQDSGKNDFYGNMPAARLAFVMTLVVCLVSGCLVMPQHRFVPHANIKIEVPADKSDNDVLDQLEDELFVLGYTKQKNDWQSWSFLDEERLEAKKQEREYVRGPFRLSYRPERDKTYRAFGRLHLHFYEERSCQFSQAGFAEYASISEVLSRIGFPPSAQDEIDANHAREVRSPEWFNERHQLPPLRDRLKELLISLVGLVPYVLIIIWPGFSWALGNVQARGWSTPKQFFAYSATCGLLFAPAPLPLTMFGPGLLVPMPLFLPLALGAPAGVFLWLFYSVAVTSLIAAGVFAISAVRKSRRATS